MKTNIAIVLIGLLISSLGAQAMGFFKKCMFSAVEGIVLSDGKPVEGVKIKRRYLWGAAQKEETDITTTNAEGKFNFPPLYNSAPSITLLPLHEASVSQQITFYHKDEEFDAWSFQRRNYKLGGEFDKNPLELICDLGWESKTHNEDDYLNSYFGICKLKEY